MQPDKQTAGLNVMALVSVGRHPQSGRERRADQDGRAVELGLALAGSKLAVVHAGDPTAPALRGYAGMGVESLQVLALEAEHDAVPALVDYLREQRADIVLTGVRSEGGESSGMVPYLLAEALGMPIVGRIADVVSVQAGFADVLLALPRGQRRAVRVAVPFIATVDTAAPAARQSAYGPGLRAGITGLQASRVVDEESGHWTESVAKPRPKRMKVVKAKTAAERFKAATAKPQGQSGKVLKGVPASEQAQAIFELLLEEKVL